MRQRTCRDHWEPGVNLTPEVCPSIARRVGGSEYHQLSLDITSYHQKVKKRRLPHPANLHLSAVIRSYLHLNKICRSPLLHRFAVVCTDLHLFLISKVEAGFFKTPNLSYFAIKGSSRFCCFSTASSLSKENNGRETPRSPRFKTGLIFSTNANPPSAESLSCLNTHPTISPEDISLPAS